MQNSLKQISAKSGGAHATPAAEPLSGDTDLLTEAMFALDDRETACVEVNFRDMSARVVETSDAPRITREVLETLGAPVKTTSTFFYDREWDVQVQDGMSLGVQVAALRVLQASREAEVAIFEGEGLFVNPSSETDGDGESSAENPTLSDLSAEGQASVVQIRIEQQETLTCLQIAQMFVVPRFSFQGQGEGHPIEDRSPAMREALDAAWHQVNTWTEDAIYQCEVRRGLPADMFAMFGESFEMYEVGGKSKPYVDMSEREFAAAESRHVSRRHVYVSQMIQDPVLCLPTETSAEGYPVDKVSERFLKTLFAAHQVVNVREAGLRSLERFRQSTSNAAGTETGGAVVVDDGGPGVSDGHRLSG